jgi:hypothetical protein
MSDPNLWAMDLEPCPEPDGLMQPVRAHLIRSSYTDARGEVRVSACGKEFTAGNHLRGWWGSGLGRLPLQDHAIHCGLGVIVEQRGKDWQPS